MGKNCNKCYDTYGISCTESDIWWREIVGRANFHGKHSINECRDKSRWRLFLTLLIPTIKKKTTW